MKDKVFEVLQRVGRSFMLPIALLPIAGLLLGIGSSFTNQTTIETYRLSSFIYEGGALYTVLEIMSKAGSAVFDNLALLFAMGVSIGMAKAEKAVAALSGAISYLIMNTSINALITANGGIDAMPENSTASVLGITTLQTGVFGGIIVGLGVAALHNRFYKIALPQVLSFFGGTRFVPIVCSVTYLIVGIILFYVWPVIQTGISKLGLLVLNSGYVGTLIYGIIERALIPFGLHHVFYMPFWQTELGGSMIIDGVTITGAQNIFFAQLGSKSTEVFSVSATRFMAGKFPYMIFGLPAAALAMYKTARPEKRKAAGGLLLSAALTSMLTGITEPLEFTFLFVAPIMYAVHCVFAGISFMLMHILNVGVGMTFSGGIIDLLLFGVFQGNAKTNWVNIIIVGVFYAIIYYFVFYFMITKLNLKTPGREDDGEVTRLYSKADMKKENKALKKSDSFDETSFYILKGLGEKENISDIDCCATRLRVTVKDPNKVDGESLKLSGASGIIKKGRGVQVVYGPQVSVIKSRLEDFISSDFSGEETDFETEKSERKKVSSKGESNDKSKYFKDEIYAPCDGELIDIKDVKDEVFSKKVLGDGCAIKPYEGKVYAPCDGVVDTVFDTMHALNIISKNKTEILIHIGIDTVKLNGKYFHAHVSDGKKIKKGDLLVSFDPEKINRAGYSTDVITVICDSEKYSKITVSPAEKITKKDKIIIVEN